MKKTFFLILSTLLLFGCQAIQPYPNENTTEPSTQVIAPSTQTTAPSAAPTETCSSESTESSTDPTPTDFDVDTWKQYSNQPETYRIIQGYNPQSSYDYPGKGFDRSQLVEGEWYILDDGDIFPLSVNFASFFDISSEHLYYTFPDQPRTVYRSDLHMEETMVVYESEYGDIGYIQFSGFDANGQLVLLEGGNRIVFYDIPTGEIEVVLEASKITWFSYSPVDHLKDWKSDIYNPIINWYGSLTDEVFAYYVYYLETGANRKLTT